MLSNTKQKQGLRFFWTKHWKYERTPEDWVMIIDKPRSGAKEIRLLETALAKMCRERLIEVQEKERLWEMIKSPDNESVLLAITIMSRLKPKKFKKLKL